MDKVDAVVVGAGIVGLAIARALAMQGREVIVLEKESSIGSGTSSRNSEVIHAGIYYPPGSLKAQLCVAGKAMLYAYCSERGVTHRRTGKLIVATSQREESGLEALHARAAANGVDDLVWLTPAQVRGLEPEVVCTAALLSPSTGIVDSHGLMLAFQGDAENCGAHIAFRSELVWGKPDAGRIVLGIAGESGETSQLECRLLVNCAGHGAHQVAAGIRGFPPERLPPRFLAKGNYFSVSGRTPFRHLIYPMPVDGGLGIHVTLDLAGRMRLGPDLHWVDDLDYTVDANLAGSFRDAVARYWPGIRHRELLPSYSGIRPKIIGPGGGAPDFVVQTSNDHGISGLVNLFGIESPGLTSSMSLAALVADTCRDVP